MDNKNIFVSVLMSVYEESQDTLKEAINSILNQSFANIEFLVFLDKPDNDSLWSFLQKCASEDSRLIIHRNSKNRFLAGTLNDELRIAKGDYIVRMDGDDISVPNRIEKLVNYMEDHSDVGVASSWMKEFGHSSCFDNRLVKYEKDFEKMKVIYLCQTPIAHAPCIIRRRIISEYGPSLYNERCSKTQDYELWSRLIQAGVVFGMVPEPLYLRRSAQFAGTNPIKYQVILNQICRKNVEGILSKVGIELHDAIDGNLIKEVHVSVSNSSGVLKKQLQMILCMVYSNVYHNPLKRLFAMIKNRDLSSIVVLSYLPLRMALHYFFPGEITELNNIVSSPNELIYQ